MQRQIQAYRAIVVVDLGLTPKNQRVCQSLGL